MINGTIRPVDMKVFLNEVSTFPIHAVDQFFRGWKARKYLLLPVEGEKCP
jgi:hypothetical protein